MSSLDKLKKRTTKQTTFFNSEYSQFISDYELYFSTVLNKCDYTDKYDSSINGQCIILDVSDYNNEKKGDEKWLTTLPSSKLSIGSVVKLDFSKELTEYWVIIDEEHLAIPSHKKFKISPLYHFGTVIKKDNTTFGADTRIVNNNAKIEIKEIYFPKTLNIKKGDYIKYPNRTYIVKDIEDNLSLPFAKSYECNNSLNAKGWDEPILGYFDNSSYGDKGIEDTNYLTMTDGKLYCLVPDNKKTKSIPLDMRFILDHDSRQVYKVIKTDTTTTGLDEVRRITFEIVEAVEKDDFINNIAYNAFLDNAGTNPQPTPSNNWNIVSDDGNLAIGRMRTRTFSVVDSNKVLSTDNWTITVDQTGLAKGFITINKTTNNSISIANNSGYSQIPLKISFLRTSDNYKLDVEVKLTAK